MTAMTNEARTSVLDPAIRAYYERPSEEDRLNFGPGQLEALRTRQLIQRFAPPAPAIVLDIGGAAGAYALWLAELGYRVHLVDPVRRLLGVALERSAAARLEFASATQGDARALAFDDGAADFVLLLGPLYHLISAVDRVRALTEAARVLKPGGVLFAAGISRWASALDALSRDLYQDPSFYAIVEQDLQNGQHRNPTEKIGWFTTAYFHEPDELRAEVNSARLVLENLYGLEGPGWLYADFNERWSDSRRRGDLIRTAEVVETEPSMIGVSAHILAIATKPH
jgi:ubiquinone/menaquinone biosynthesis C-methylase UbiE